MCHAGLSPTNFHALLLCIDQDLAEGVRVEGCRHCGGVLHRADYPRKPWGVGRQSMAYYARRLSLCCARDGCRRRSTPATVRFLGRRRYVAVIMILVSALTHGVTPRRGERLRQALGVSRRTLVRWRRWWRERFVATAFWRVQRARFAKALETARLPVGLLAAFEGSMRQRLLHLLVFLAPLSGDGPNYLLAERNPQSLTVFPQQASL